MKKFLIALVVVVVLIVAIYFALPQGAKDYLNYYKIKQFDDTTYSEILTARNAVVLGDADNTNPCTYGDVLKTLGEYEYWTYEDTVNSDGSITKTINGYGSRITLSYGESGDRGILQSAKVQFSFLLDDRGGYTLITYVNGSALSEEDRNQMLVKMCQLTRSGN